MSNVDKLILDKTDLDLNTSSVLPEAAIDVGLGPDTLSADTRAALKTGFITADKFDPDHPEFGGDGLEDTTDRLTPATASPALGGFLGRPAGIQR